MPRISNERCFSTAPFCCASSMSRRQPTSPRLFGRNFNGGVGLSWQTAFGTDDRAEVERYCVQSDIQWEWQDEDRLRTRQIRSAVARHPRTGEPVWFNHIAFFHLSTLEPQVRE